MARRSEASWTTWAAVICAVVAISWFLAGRLATKQNPADQNIDPPQATQTPTAPELNVSAGKSINYPIGSFSIRADRVTNNSASLVVTSPTKDTYRFKKATSGQRLMIPSHDGMHYLDVTGIHGNVVSLTMGKLR